MGAGVRHDQIKHCEVLVVYPSFKAHTTNECELNKRLDITGTTESYCQTRAETYMLFRKASRGTRSTYLRHVKTVRDLNSSNTPLQMNKHNPTGSKKRRLRERTALLEVLRVCSRFQEAMEFLGWYGFYFIRMKNTPVNWALQEINFCDSSE